MKIATPVIVLMLASSFLVLGLDSQDTAAFFQRIKHIQDPANAAEADDIWTDESRPRADDTTGSRDAHDIGKTDSKDMEPRGLNRKENADLSDNVILNKEAERSKSDKSVPQRISSSSSVISETSQKMAPPAETSDRARNSGSNAHAHSSGRTEDPDNHPSKLSELSKSDKEKVLKSLETSFLNIVGLKSRPQPDRSVLTVPQYMLDMYHQFVQSNRRKRRSPTQYRNGLHNSNTIRSFVQQENDENHPENVVRLQFDMTSLPNHEMLQAAELRLYRTALQSPVSNMSSADSGGSDSANVTKERQRIDVYQVMQPPRKSNGGEAITRLLDTRVVETSNTRWETFDVTPALNAWRKSSKNHGLEVRVSKISAGQKGPLRHVRLKRSAPIRPEGISHDDDSWSAERPLLLTYSNDPSASSAKDNRKRRATNRKQRDTRSKRRSKKDRRKKRKGHPSRKNKERSHYCKRRTLYVDFNDVGWNDWIVAPPGYDAFYCYGECPFPLADHFNTTNHAVVQQFVHSVDSQAVPKPCCVPTELSEVALLYFDEDRQVVLRKYEDMVVEACGCR